jgi:hypothetical protein
VFVSRISYSFEDHCLFSQDIIFGCYLGFPCNQFGGQEPGTPEEIEQFVARYNVTFPIMSKVTVLEFLNNLWGLEPSRNRAVVPARKAIHSLAELDPWNRFLKF